MKPAAPSGLSEFDMAVIYCVVGDENMLGCLNRIVLRLSGVDLMNHNAPTRQVTIIYKKNTKLDFIMYATLFNIQQSCWKNVDRGVTAFALQGC
jgi:hypothetical protein